MLKIAGGTFRGRRLASPGDGQQTRPWPQRVREAVFNLLRGWFDDAAVLDLYAGVGSMGLEAVSRGARQVLLVEKNRSIYQLLKENIDVLACGDRATALMSDALGSTALARAPRPLDIVFIDPPYAAMESEVMRRRVLGHPMQLHPLMAPSGWLVLRTPLNPKNTNHDVEGFDGPEVHRYGSGMWVLLYQRRESGQSS